MTKTKVCYALMPLLLLTAACGGDNGNETAESLSQDTPTTSVVSERPLLETTSTVVMPTTTETMEDITQTMEEPNENVNKAPDNVSDQEYIYGYGAYAAAAMVSEFRDITLDVEMVAESEDERAMYDPEAFIVYGLLGGIIAPEHPSYYPFIRCAHTNTINRLGAEADEKTANALREYDFQWSIIGEPSDHADFMNTNDLLSVEERDTIVASAFDCLDTENVSTLLAPEPDFACFSAVPPEEYIELASQAIRFTFFPDYQTIIDMIGKIRPFCLEEMVAQAEPAMRYQLGMQLAGLGLTDEEKECAVKKYARFLIEEMEMVYFDDNNPDMQDQIEAIFEMCFGENP